MLALSDRLIDVSISEDVKARAQGGSRLDDGVDVVVPEAALAHPLSGVFCRG